MAFTWFKEGFGFGGFVDSVEVGLTKARKIAPVGGAYRPGREASSAVKF